MSDAAGPTPVGPPHQHGQCQHHSGQYQNTQNVKRNPFSNKTAEKSVKCLGVDPLFKRQTENGTVSYGKVQTRTTKKKKKKKRKKNT